MNAEREYLRIFHEHLASKLETRRKNSGALFESHPARIRRDNSLSTPAFL